MRMENLRAVYTNATPYFDMLHKTKNLNDQPERMLMNNSHKFNILKSKNRYTQDEVDTILLQQQNNPSKSDAVNNEKLISENQIEKLMESKIKTSLHNDKSNRPGVVHSNTNNYDNNTYDNMNSYRSSLVPNTKKIRPNSSDKYKKTATTANYPIEISINNTKVNTKIRRPRSANAILVHKTKDNLKFNSMNVEKEIVTMVGNSTDKEPLFQGMRVSDNTSSAVVLGNDTLKGTGENIASSFNIYASKHENTSSYSTQQLPLHYTNGHDTNNKNNNEYTSVTNEMEMILRNIRAQSKAPANLF